MNRLEVKKGKKQMDYLYFKDVDTINTLEELEDQYYDLILRYHSDFGGSKEMMVPIDEEFDKAKMALQIRDK